MRTNFHTHHYLCGHAIGRIEDYVKEAISKNVKILGISDHTPVEKGLSKFKKFRDTSDN